MSCMTLRLPDELREALDTQAREEKRSRSAQIEVYIRRGLAADRRAAERRVAR